MATGSTLDVELIQGSDTISVGEQQQLLCNAEYLNTKLRQSTEELRQSEVELRLSKEELRYSTEELRKHTEKLRQSEELLQSTEILCSINKSCKRCKQNSEKANKNREENLVDLSLNVSKKRPAYAFFRKSYKCYKQRLKSTNSISWSKGHLHPKRCEPPFKRKNNLTLIKNYLTMTSQYLRTMTSHLPMFILHIVLLVYVPICKGEFTEEQLAHFRRDRAEAAEKWAPLVFLHPDERYFPLDVHTFLQNVIPRKIPENERTPEPPVVVSMSRSLDIYTLPEGVEGEDTYLIAPIDEKCKNCPLPNFLHGTKPSAEYSPPMYAVITSCLPSTKTQQYVRSPRNTENQSKQPRRRRFRLKRRRRKLSFKDRLKLFRRRRTSLPSDWDTYSETEPLNSFTSLEDYDTFKEGESSNQSIKRFSLKAKVIRDDLEDPVVKPPSTTLLPPRKRLVTTLQPEPENETEIETTIQNDAGTTIQNEAETTIQNEVETTIQNEAETTIQNKAETTIQNEDSTITETNFDLSSTTAKSDDGSSSELQDKYFDSDFLITTTTTAAAAAITTSKNNTSLDMEANASVSKEKEANKKPQTTPHENESQENDISEGNIQVNDRHRFTVTYWMFYPYSQGKQVCTSRLWILGRVFKPRLRNKCYGDLITLNSHVGDWEHVSIYFEDDLPTRMYVSTHTYGAYYIYEPNENLFVYRGKDTRLGLPLNPKYPPIIKMDGTHPVLYAAVGSHGLWGSPGVHRYENLVPLEDKTTAGTPWKSWKNIDIIDYRDPDHLRPDRQWLKFYGRWGNPSNGCHRALFGTCDLASGPTGIPLKRENFPCHLPDHPTFFPEI